MFSWRSKPINVDVRGDDGCVEMEGKGWCRSIVEELNRYCIGG